MYQNCDDGAINYREIRYITSVFSTNSLRRSWTTVQNRIPTSHPPPFFMMVFGHFLDIMDGRDESPAVLIVEVLKVAEGGGRSSKQDDWILQ